MQLLIAKVLPFISAEMNEYTSKWVGGWMGRGMETASLLFIFLPSFTMGESFYSTEQILFAVVIFVICFLESIRVRDFPTFLYQGPGAT